MPIHLSRLNKLDYTLRSGYYAKPSARNIVASTDREQLKLAGSVLPSPKGEWLKDIRELFVNNTVPVEL